MKLGYVKISLREFSEELFGFMQLCCQLFIDFRQCESPDDKRFHDYHLKRIERHKIPLHVKPLQQKPIEFEIGEMSPSSHQDQKSFDGFQLEENFNSTELDDVMPEFLDAYCLDPKEQFRYDVFKNMYADILYRWEFFIQRSEIVKTIRSHSKTINCGSVFSSSRQRTGDNKEPSLVDYSDLFKVRFQVKEPMSLTVEPRSPISKKAFYQSPSFTDTSQSSQMLENFKKSTAAARNRGSEPNVGINKILMNQNNTMRQNWSAQSKQTSNVERDKEPSKLGKLSRVEKDTTRGKIAEFYCVICRQAVRSL